MQVIYRVMLYISYHVGYFDFNNFEQACKFADAAKISNVACKDSDGKKVKVRISLLFKDEIDKGETDD